MVFEPKHPTLCHILGSTSKLSQLLLFNRAKRLLPLFDYVLFWLLATRTMRWVKWTMLGDNTSGQQAQLLSGEIDLNRASS